MSNQQSTTEERNQERRSQMAHSMAQEGASSVMRQTGSKVAERKQNPNFLDELQKSKVDTDRYDWVENEMGPLLSGSHILGVRSEGYVERQDLLNKAEAEIMAVEANPGRLLRENPSINAVMQDGVDSAEDPDYRKPVTQTERRVLREATDVATNKQAMAKDGRGLDAVSKVTSESQVRRDEEEQASGVIGRMKGVMK
jgi:hypothetical protein